MGKLFNFSWSFSKGEQLLACERGFFFQYASRDEPFSDAATQLKKTTTPVMMAGTVIDSIIGRALLESRQNGSRPTNLSQTGERIFNKWWRDSVGFAARLRTGQALPSGASVLLHHYLGEPEQDATREETLNQVVDSLRCFEGSEVQQRITEAPPTGWGEIRIHGDGKFPPQFDLDSGLTVWAAYDFHFADRGVLHILDWKSGRKTPRSMEKAARQLEIYALFGHKGLGFQPDLITVQAVWLRNSALWEPDAIQESNTVRAADSIKSQADTVLIRLRPEGREFLGKPIYVADMEDFPPSPRRGKCQMCRFLSICREGQIETGGDFPRTSGPADEEDPFSIEG